MWSDSTLDLWAVIELIPQGKKTPGAAPRAFSDHLFLKSFTTLEAAHLSRGGPFLTLLNRKLHPFPFAETFEPVRFDGRMMHKDILATPLDLDKAEAFAIIEPLDGTCLTFTHDEKLL